MWLSFMFIQDSQLFSSAGIILASNSLNGVSELFRPPIHGLSEVLIISSAVEINFGRLGSLVPVFLSLWRILL